MRREDPRVDSYIAQAAGFAQPILRHLRRLVHAACPDVEETLKWGMPHFDYKGMMCGMAAFKNHCTFSFWKGALIFEKGADGIKEGAMGHLGRISSVSDLPAEKVLIGYIKQAARLNEEGIKLPSRSRLREKAEPIVPDYFTAALKKNRKALTTFEKLRPSHKKEYVEWLTEARREETRNTRLRTAIDWLAQGKPRDWKYR